MGDQEVVSFKVYVSCIQAVDEFYVYKAMEEGTIKQIQKLLNRRDKGDNCCVRGDDCMKGTDHKEDVMTVVPGDIVVAQFGHDKLMYRARVVNKFVELDFGLIDVDMAEVVFIDYGNTATVPVSSIRPLSPSLLALAPLAIKCSMSDCMALGEDTTTEFSKLVSGHCLVMEVMGRKKEVLEVDLVREIGDTMGYASVRDVLVLSGKAVFYSSPNLTIPNVEERKYKKLPVLTAGSEHTVMLSHLHKLSHEKLPQLSVQLLSDQHNLALQLPSLMDQMGAVYGVKRSEELWGLGRCWPGMVCAVRDSRDKMWYRGEVVTTIRGRMVLVKYVDFGNAEQVPAHRMRRLFTDFLEMPALAMRVCLGARVEEDDTMVMLKEGISLVDLNMKIVEEGSDKILPTVDLDVEGVSVCDWLRKMAT